MEPGANALWRMLAQAGWTMVPLYVCSIAALAVIIHKFAQFGLGGVYRRAIGSAVGLLAGPDGVNDLTARCEADDSPLGRVMAVAARAVSRGAEQVEADATRAAVAELDHFGGWLPLLAFIAQVAPLFGLLGTVLGMVDLFSSMEAAGAEIDTTTLSAGIWKALLTTAAGLMIAIPTLGMHMYFRGRLDKLRHRIEDAVGRIAEAA